MPELACALIFAFCFRFVSVIFFGERMLCVFRNFPQEMMARTFFDAPMPDTGSLCTYTVSSLLRSSFPFTIASGIRIRKSAARPPALFIFFWRRTVWPSSP